MGYRRKSGKRIIKYKRGCAICGEPGRVRGIERHTWANVFLCDLHWEDYKDQESETVIFEGVE